MGGVGSQLLRDIDALIDTDLLTLDRHQASPAAPPRRCRAADLTYTWDNARNVLSWTCRNCPRRGYGVRALEDHTMWPRLADDARAHVLGYRPCRPRVIPLTGPRGSGWSWLCPTHLALDFDDRWARLTADPGGAHDGARAHLRAVETGVLT